MNAVFKEFKQTLNALSAANTYLDCLVQTKTYLQLIILLLFCIATVYLPSPAFTFNFINNIDIVLQYAFKALCFSLPISLVFLFIMWIKDFYFLKNHIPSAKNFFLQCFHYLLYNVAVFGCTNIASNIHRDIKSHWE